MPRTILLAGIFTVVLAPPSAGAGSASDSLRVSATVTNNCVVAAGVLDFEGYDAITTNSTTPKDGTAGISLRCTANSTVRVGMDLGLNGSGSARRMSDGSAHLDYEIYSDPERTIVWGDGETDSVVETGTGADELLTAYGRVPAGQTVPSGEYADRITVTVDF